MGKHAMQITTGLCGDCQHNAWLDWPESITLDRCMPVWQVRQECKRYKPRAQQVPEVAG